jgi:hypothetical protein
MPRNLGAARCAAQAEAAPAVHLEPAGVPRSVAMKLTGHKTEAVYRRYAIVPDADLREGVTKLARLA